MKITYKWLCQHIQFYETDIIKLLNQIEDILIKLGIEVENVHFINPILKCKIIYIENLPKMKVRKAVITHNIDSKYLSYKYDVIEVLCGADNARENLYTAFAPINTLLPNGINIQPRSIRGYNSYGMLCSGDEIGDAVTDGILECSENDEDILKYDDILINISISTNRSDLMCIRGIARELSFKNLGKMKALPLYKPKEEYKIDIENKTNLYFTYTYIENIQLHDYINAFLKHIGQYSNDIYINLYRFILLDIGIPIHIYNAKKINKITIEENQSIIVKNESEIISYAGMQGLLNADTNYNIIEAAHIDSQYITKNETLSAKYFRLGIDRSISIPLYCGTLFKEGKIYTTNTSNDINTIKKKIFLSLSEFYKISGYEYALEQIKNILESFEFNCEITRQKNNLNDEFGIFCEPPHYRYDINNSRDIIEEILRISGIDTNYTSSYIKYSNDIHNQVADALLYQNIQEVKTFIFDEDGEIEIDNPFDSNLKYCRNTLERCMARKAEQIYNNGQKDIKIFEIGTIFTNNTEEQRLGILFAGKPSKSLLISSYHNQSNIKYKFSDLKKIIDYLSNIISINYLLVEDKTLIFEEGFAKIAPWYYYCEMKIKSSNKNKVILNNCIDISIKTEDNWLQIKKNIPYDITLIDYYDEKKVYTFSIDKKHYNNLLLLLETLQYFIS